jgi:GntR family transcriptional regulator/MocR family aminotransferase
VSEANSARNTRASGRLMIRPRRLPSVPRLRLRQGAHSNDARAKWHPGKVQFHGDSVVRFESGAAGAARPRRGQPLRSQLEAGLREAIRSGRLRAGERLPSSRELARELGVSRGLVQECYGQLLAEGYLTSQTGSATRVADVGGKPGRYPPVGRRAAVGRPRPGACAPLIADFRAGVPDLSSFPARRLGVGDSQACTRCRRRTWDTATRAAARCCARCSPGTCGGCAPPPPDPGADDHQHRLRAGTQPGPARAGPRRRRDRCVAFEDPGYGSAQIDETVRAAAGDGPATSATCRSTRRAWWSASWRPAAPRRSWSPRRTSPPPGWCCPRRRHALTDWARRGGAYIVEDDYDSEFRYDKEPVGVLQGLAPDRVFLLGTASKALAPAVRLGWVHAPRRWPGRSRPRRK